MRLSEFMAETNRSSHDMAALIGNVSASAVAKWARRERVPRPDQQRRIYEVTASRVTPNDFVLLDHPDGAGEAA